MIAETQTVMNNLAHGTPIAIGAMWQLKNKNNYSHESKQILNFRFLFSRNNHYVS